MGLPPRNRGAESLPRGSGAISLGLGCWLDRVSSGRSRLLLLGDLGLIFDTFLLHGFRFRSMGEALWAGVLASFVDEIIARPLSIGME